MSNTIELAQVAWCLSPDGSDAYVFFWDLDRQAGLSKVLGKEIPEGVAGGAHL
jgi:hypothetical protein